ncbi:MAG: ATP-binding cassette domain-containing protein [Chloroflexi bacterium]|nr:ATP-binding cassette domain-containing protein [Chloroflexota bacterium]
MIAFISLNDVSIRRRDRILFEGLCWEMLGNQHWAVIGPNGSGKSTLMKALCGLLPIVKGSIVYHFLDGGQSAAHDRIAYVTFESQRMVLGDEAFYQERWNAGVNEDTLSVSEFLSEPGVKGNSPFHIVARHTDETYQARLRDVVEQLEISKLLDRNVVQLSNGERRKVTIARALLKRPRLLILDNPLAGLDERFRAKMAQNLENLMQSEMRVIIVATDRDEMPRSITHVLSVKDNCVEARGPRKAMSFRAEREISTSQKRFLVAKGAPRNDIGSVALVQMQNVTVAYNGTPILRDVNWTVRENERWALLGPNGAGKTTLLSLILADNPQAYANDITLFGKRRGSGESIWEIKQNIGWVAPELQLYYPRNATCLDVVCSGWFDSVGLYRQCSPDQREAALTWLRRFGLAEHADTTFAQLSEGEQRLALLARALVKRPALLVLDEPCQGLDLENRDRVLQAIDWIGSQPRTSMIYVTHRADELPQTITHVLRINDGQVIEPETQRN